MSHGLLADSVDTSLASLLYSCEVHDHVFLVVNRERRVKPTHCLSAVAELLVFMLTIHSLL